MAVAVVVAVTGCGKHESVKIAVTGSSTIAPLMAEIAKRYESKHPGVRIDVQTGGSSRGVTDARKGLSPIGMVSRALKDDEKDLKAHTIAKDGICMIVHKDNKVGPLSADQIRGIYKGEITSWSAVGAHDAPITVVQKAEGRSTLELFLSHFKLKNPECKAHVIIGDNEQGVRTVAGNEDGIGYVSVGTAEFSHKSGQPIRCLDLGGVPATIENVKNEKFPMVRPLNLVTKGEVSKEVADLIAFAQSPEVDDLVKAQAFVPLR